MNYIPQPLFRNEANPVGLQDYQKSGLESLADFAEKSKQLETSLQVLASLCGDGASRAVAQLQQDLADFEPAITIVGQVKSGKTTLVNALAGWSDLLPSDVNPWTSVVTSLHLIPGQQRREVGARFQLMKEDEWDRLLSKGGRLGELAQRTDAGSELEKIRQQIEVMREKSRNRLGKKFELLLGQKHEYGYFDRNLLERYICLGDDFLSDAEAEDAGKQGWFADITRSADLYLHCNSMPFQMCIRDTPGVNDTFLMREQVTIGALRDSRVCVVVLSAQQALTSTDMGLIRLITNLKSRDVIIFVNRIDELADPAAQVGEIEKSIRNTLARHQGPIDAEIIFGSAYWANKVLSDEIDTISPASAASLVNWAEFALHDKDLSRKPAEMIWQLSGMERLNRAVAEHIVSSIGNPHLRKIAGAAVTIAGSLQAANTVRVSGVANDVTVDIANLDAEFSQLAKLHKDKLSEDLLTTKHAHVGRADRAHASFLERATHSLVMHLEDYGEQIVWEYDPNGLRVLLKAAYSTYVAKATSSSKLHYRSTVEDVAELLYKYFGESVEGIELALPEPPDAPAPVSLAQTIILDFNDGWWKSWWRRTRGYKAFSDRFYAMIAAETQDFIAQFKSLPAEEFTQQLESVLNSFLDQCRAVVAEIGAGQVERGNMKGPFLSGEDQGRNVAIENLVVEFRGLVRKIEADGKLA
ncbi:MAG: dynamin family protein [bacterium]